MVRGYSRVQLWLHWGVAALIAFQLIFGEDMSRAWRSFAKTGAADMTYLVWAHILVGVAVLALVVWRLGVRMTRGVPDAPDTGVALFNLAGEWGHRALYLLMFVLPISGLIGWYAGMSWMVELHGWLKPALIVLVGLHVLAALWHQFIRKDGLLVRIVKASD